MTKEIRYKDSFGARDEEGKRHIIDVFVEVLSAGSVDRPSGEIEGMDRLQTRDKQLVNRIEKGKYQLATSGSVLSSDDAEAV